MLRRALVPAAFAAISLGVAPAAADGSGPTPAAWTAPAGTVNPAPVAWTEPSGTVGQAPGSTYSATDVLEAGHGFFGTLSGGLASVMERIFAQYGEPVGYILGQEASGAFFGGLRYGEGTLHTRDFGVHQVFWQGPSFGWDVGGDGARTMILVYSLPSLDTLYQRFTGVNGSAYFIGGVGMTLLAADTTYLVPVRTGVGARLGVNLGYLKFTERPTWNPF
jgi:hypothetical protein